MPPSISALFWASVPLVLLATIYQVGVPEFVTDLSANFLVAEFIANLFATTYCYVSVKTLISDFPNAECFSVSNGRFSRVFLDDTSSGVIKEQRSGHVIPGLWDGHGHLMQYGESLDSVDLFGALSMNEVKERLVQYKVARGETGTSEQWLRGVGWDQANFGGRWPVAVGSLSLHRLSFFLGHATFFSFLFFPLLYASHAISRHFPSSKPVSKP